MHRVHHLDAGAVDARQRGSASSVVAPVTMWTLTSSRAPVMPTGAPMPSCSSTTKSCGSTWRISRPAGSDTALAASIARRTSSRVISRFLPATAITPRLLKPLMCGAGQRRGARRRSRRRRSARPPRCAFLIDSTAASRLTTTPRRMPRDSATPMPTTSSCRRRASRRRWLPLSTCRRRARPRSVPRCSPFCPLPSLRLSGARRAAARGSDEDVPVVAHVRGNRWRRRAGAPSAPGRDRRARAAREVFRGPDGRGPDCRRAARRRPRRR